MSNNNQTLCTCGCCDNSTDLKNDRIENVPGLPSLHYRIGTHGSFKEAMLKALSQNPLLTKKLTSRADDDMAIAGIDAWATLLDVISFYQERIINEGFLHTATERLSIVELAKHISYSPAPGVAAGTYLAFGMNESPGAPLKALVPSGTKVQSIPEEDQMPQIFETTEQIEARVEWNAIKLQSKKRVLPVDNPASQRSRKIYLKGINTGLQPGDPLLIILKNAGGTIKWDLLKIKTVVTDPIANNTKITWEREFQTTTTNSITVEVNDPDVRIFALRQKASSFGYNASDFKTLPGNIKTEFLDHHLVVDYFNGQKFETHISRQLDSVIDHSWVAGGPAGLVNNFSAIWSGLILIPSTGTYSFITESDDGVRLWINNELMVNNWTNHGVTTDTKIVNLQGNKLYSICLHFYENDGNATIRLKWRRPDDVIEIIPAEYFFHQGDHPNWPGFTISQIAGGNKMIELDNVYQKIIKGSWLVMKRGGVKQIYKVDAAEESAKEGFMLTAKTTKLTLLGENFLDAIDRHVRDTVIFAQSELLELAEQPADDLITGPGGKQITLEKSIPDLPAKKTIIISGKRKRLEIKPSGDGLLFTIKPPTGVNPFRQLKAGDSLIILKRPGPASNDWSLKDNAGIEGTITATENQVTETASEKEDEMISEINFIDSVARNTNPTSLVLRDSISNIFDPSTMVIYANVAPSTHGETKNETLGSGDASQVFQKFELKQKPLTFISADTSTGISTTLQIRVNDILWKEAPSFYSVSPKEKVYVTSTNDAGIVTVMFGDGITGSKLPTGTENIKANYRIGIGSAGILKTNQLSMLMTPRLGVNKVSNPLPSSGAADPEGRDKARQNAPLTVLTLDRIVSAADFEYFTSAFAGIGKARADILWNGEQQIVYITIAGADKKPVPEGSPQYESLLKAIQNSGHSNHTIKIGNFSPLSFSVNAGVQIDTRYDFVLVQKNITEALKSTFSFEARNFGQDVTPAEVIAVIQSIEGVVFTDLNFLNGQDIFTNHFRLPAAIARWSGSEILPAQLLTINENSITITQRNL